MSKTEPSRRRWTRPESQARNAREAAETAENAYCVYLLGGAERPQRSLLSPKLSARLRGREPSSRGELMPTGSDFSDEDLHRLLPREACGFECILVGCEGLGSLQKGTRKVGRAKV
jgi:hypothetical protein